MQNWDLVIIGAGPAGLFAADAAAGRGLSVLVIERGRHPDDREQGDVHGLGGAGMSSDGKLNLTPRIGGDGATFGRSEAEISRLIEAVDQRMTELGVPLEYSGIDKDLLADLGVQAARAGIEFVAGRQRHIGTDRVGTVTDRFYRTLEAAGVRFLLETPVIAVMRRGDQFEIRLPDNEAVQARAVICAPGRAGTPWLRELATTLEIDHETGPIDVGVRVEFPASVYERVRPVMYDAKFRMHSSTHDDPVRTFCTNPNGYVTVENWDSFVLVNGHSPHRGLSENTNFALLTRVTLADPVEDTMRYGRVIADCATTLGGGRPLIQRLKDLRMGRRSTPARLRRASVTPTLTEATPGDISMALPARILRNILEGLDRLDRVLPGVAAEGTLIYAPEIKFYDTRYRVTPDMETTVPAFFIAGDGSGHSRGIVYSAVTGLLAGQGVLRRLTGRVPVEAASRGTMGLPMGRKGTDAF
jgi:uncharacterized protein